MTENSLFIWSRNLRSNSRRSTAEQYCWISLIFSECAAEQGKLTRNNSQTRHFGPYCFRGVVEIAQGITTFQVGNTEHA